MSQPFDADPKSIGDLFTGIDKPRLIVPPFQRGYSWEKKHVEAFWKDLVDFQKEKKDGIAEKYFLGPIVVLNRKNADTEVLDGQQRLATATMLFAAIRDTATEIGTKDSEALAHAIHTTFIAKDDAGDHIGYSLELSVLDKLYFVETVQQISPTKQKPGLKTHRNIHVAKQILQTSVRSKLSGLSSVEAVAYLKSLRNIVRSDLIMTCIRVSDEREAFRIFETLNDRGLRLSVPDLLLNYLMKKAPESDRPDIRTYWNQMTEKMGRRSISPFLRHVWVSEFGDVKHDLFTAIKAHIEEKGVVSLNYVRDCANVCTQYCALLDGDENQLGASAKFIRSLLGNLDSNSALPLLLSAYTVLDSPNFLRLTKWLLVFVVRYAVIAGMDSAGMESLLFELARDVRTRLTEETSISTEEGKKLNPRAQAKCMAHLRSSLEKHSPSDEKVAVSMNDLTLTSDQATYVVSRLANRMQSDTKEVRINEANLEHIFPRKPNHEWLEPEKLEPYLWHIGNLTMLGDRLNGDAANRSFQFKKDHYRKNSELKMAQQVATKYDDWNEASIKDRAKKLTSLVLEIWKFDNPSRV